MHMSQTDCAFLNRMVDYVILNKTENTNIWLEIFMEKSADISKDLMRTGVFKTQEELMGFLLLKKIAHNQGPVGSWTLNELLEKQGISCSTATVGRYLKLLDSKGYAIRKSNQGRILTEEGKRWLQEMSERVERAEVHDEATEALRVNEYEELLDLMRARKAIEVAAVEMAAQKATDEELSALRKSINLYYRYIAENKDHIDPALDFHSIVAEMSHNKFLKNLLDILVFEEKRVEVRMEILATRERGGIYVVQHDDIAAAIEAHDGPLASQLMSQHMDLILRTVEEQITQIKETELQNSMTGVAEISAV